MSIWGLGSKHPAYGKVAKQIMFGLFLLTLLVAGCIPEYDAEYNSRYVDLYVNDNLGGYIKNKYNETLTIKAVSVFKGAESTMWIKELDPGQNTSIVGDQWRDFRYYVLVDGVEKELIKPDFQQNNCKSDVAGKRMCDE